MSNEQSLGRLKEERYTNVNDFFRMSEKVC
jgi:hypothetical protein